MTKAGVKVTSPIVDSLLALFVMLYLLTPHGYM